MSYALRYFKRDNVHGDIWFEKMTAIGPYTTFNLSAAMKFETREEAAKHPAMSHPLCLLDVVDITCEDKALAKERTE